MKRSTLRTLITSLLLLQVGCSSSDYSEELSCGYFFNFESGEDRAIISHLPESENIYADVVDYAYNEDFILAKQEPNYNAYKEEIASAEPVESKEELKSALLKADSVLKADPFYRNIFSNKVNYWIISGKNKKVYGPFQYEAYLQAREALGVPSKLNLSTD